jgi:Ca2+-binding RTX toxin-like protein
MMADKILTSGNDNYTVVALDDAVYGLGGKDVILTNGGTIGNHDIYAGGGDKFIGSSIGTIFSQYLYGGYGNQTMSGGDSGGYFYGADGTYLMTGGVFDFTVAGTTGAIIPYFGAPNSGADFMYGGDGRVAEYGFGGADFLYGGASDDRGTFLNFIDADAVALGKVKLGLFGGAGADSLFGNKGNDDLYGGSEVDWLDGGIGNDVLYGGTGADVMLGGSGDDIYEVDNAGDFVAEVNDAQFGIADNVFAYVDYAMQWGVDNLLMNYGTQTYGIGNELTNIIIGNGSANVIEGKGGYDTLTGGAGSDTFLIRAGFGVDVITDFTAGAGTQDAIQFKTAMFANFAAVMAAATQHGTDTWISASTTDVIVLSGVLKTGLHSDDFQFIA